MIVRLIVGVALLSMVTTSRAATPMAAAGNVLSLALHSDGTVRSWGTDGRGELGIGSVLSSIAPLVVEGLPPVRSGAEAAAAGAHHALVIAMDGSVWSWGGNSGGQLGDGSTIDRSRPMRVEGLSAATGVAGGLFHSIAITGQGDVWAWGINGSGQLGIPIVPGALSPQTRPARIGLGNAVAVSAGRLHSLVLLRDGTVWAFGDNQAGQLGDGTLASRSTPARVAGLSDVIAISAGAHHNLALRRDGTVWSWGLNDEGQLGDGTTVTRRTPVQVPVVAARRIAAGFDDGPGDSYVVAADGAVWTWGGSSGSVAPIALAGYTDAAQIDAGGNFSVVVRADGTVWTEGSNSLGSLGRGGDGRLGPGPIHGLTRATAVAAGSFFAIAVREDGHVYAWGDNASGQLASARVLNRTAPIAVPGLQSVRQIAAGGSSLALRSDGSVASWGAFGERTSAPRTVAGLFNIVQVAAGSDHAVALRSDGTVWTWGFNDFGQLGRDTVGEVYFDPGIVPGLQGVIRIAAGEKHTAAVRFDGTVWVWGRNASNMLGVPATASCQHRSAVESSPCTPASTRVPGVESVIDIATGPTHRLALRSDGTVWSWGGNLRGALGDGTQASRPTPAPVPGLDNVLQVAAGGEDILSYSIALKRDGTVWSWGDNTFGQLGEGARPSRPAPARVEGMTEISGVSAGSRHVFATRSDGVVWAWGGNEWGQIGDGTLADRFKPVVVVRENGAGSFDADNWYLDLNPEAAAAVALDKSFPVLASGRVGATDANVAAQIGFRAIDAGRAGSVYVFAFAPATIVRGAAADPSMPMMKAKAGGKSSHVQCVLAQLNAAGQLIGVSVASLQAHVSGVLAAQGQSVTILDGVPTANIGGATFFVGYGSSATGMINGGTNRGVVTVSGADQCRPEAPQTGWWWNPLEDGRGFSIEHRGNNLFFASFLYDVSGRSTWYVSTGPVSLDGSLYMGDLLSARGGQTLGGSYPGFPTLRNEGAITLAFNTASTGTLVWPGGTVPIQRFNIVPGGLSLPAVAGQPESGWWWNPEESGRGFFLEFQNGWLDIAGYMYDEAGNPVWYLTVGEIAGSSSARRFSGNWWSYGDGMTLMGPWRQHRRTSDNVAPVMITFSGPDTATMTLPNGRSTTLRRHRF